MGSERPFSALAVFQVPKLGTSNTPKWPILGVACPERLSHVVGWCVLLPSAPGGWREGLCAQGPAGEVEAGLGKEGLGFRCSLNTGIGPRQEPGGWD